MHLPLLFALCMLALACHGSQSSDFCTYRAHDGSVYDLSTLKDLDDQVTSVAGSMELFYFAICRNTWTCEGAACSMLGDESRMLGDLQSMEWSEKYTHNGQGISLVYHGESNCDSSQASSFIITAICDESLTQRDALLVAFSSECEKTRVILKSRYACPLSAEYALLPASDSMASTLDDKQPQVLPWLIFGSILGGLLSLSLFAAILVVFRRKQKENGFDPLVPQKDYPLPSA